MTILVGVRSEECAVLAADGAATYGSLSGHTIRQEIRKIRIVGSGAAIGTSGPVGLGQRLAGELTDPQLQEAIAGLPGWQAMNLVRAKFVPHLIQEMAIAAEAGKALGQRALDSALSDTLAILTVKDGPALFQFNHQGAPEEFKELPWVTVGSGQNSADSFATFLRRIFWPNRPPSREEAVFTALWTVLQCIESAPPGVGGKPQLVILERGGAARELDDEELLEHRESIRAAEKALAEFRDNLGTGTGPSLPSAPAG